MQYEDQNGIIHEKEIGGNQTVKTFKIDKLNYVLYPENIHFYNLKLYAFFSDFNINGVNQCLSDYTVKVHTQWIDEFKHTATGKPWQVVVSNQTEEGDPQNLITGKAHTSPDCSSFQWQFEKNWELVNNFRKEATNMYIPYDNNPLEDAHTNFGDTYGNISFSAKNRDGTIYTVFSYNFPDYGGLTPSFPYVETVMNPRKTTKVYFHKNENSEYTYNNQPDEDPNWFYYWKIIIPWKFIKSLTHAYSIIDDDTGANSCIWFGGWTSTKPIDNNGNYTQEFSTTICDQMGHDRKDFESDATGIDAFSEIIIHENEHIAIKKEIWGPEWPLNYDISLDIDKDLYKDSWEQVRINKGSKIFTLDDDRDKAYSKYEEPRCDKKANNKNNWMYNNDDWSYDRQEFYHKNW